MSKINTSESYEAIIKNNYNTLRSSEKKVADYILLHSNSIHTMSLSQLSLSAGVSEPTVMRFVKNLGFSGYSHFKLKLASDLGREAALDHNNDLLIDLHISREDNTKDVPAKLIAMTTKALEDTLKLVDIRNYQKAIDMVVNARLIDVYGVGNSGSIANDLTNKFLRIGLTCRSYTDNHLQQICATHLTKDDVAIAISHSGSTMDIVDTLKLAKESGAKTIAITNFKASTITQYADLCFFTGDLETSFYSETMCSRISQLACVDMLYMGVLLSDYDKYTQRINKTNLVVSARNY